MKDTILIVDDESNVLSALKRLMVNESWHVHTARSADRGLEVMKGTSIKVVISDERMPGMSGSEFLSCIKGLYPDTIRILLTGHASVEAAMHAVNNGEIYRFFAKPWNDIEIKLAIRAAIEKYDLEAANRILLATVRQQRDELVHIEKTYPGITSMEKDEEGNLIIPDTPDTQKDLHDALSDILSIHQ